MTTWRENRDEYFKKYRADPKNKERHRISAKKYRDKNKEKIKEYHKKYHDGVRTPKIYSEFDRKYAKEFARKRRIICLRHYGGEIPKCACCGESEIKFLCIDHVNNDGAKHRKEIGSIGIYGWLKKNNFPNGFQVLCHNCNCAKGFYGKCPHKE